MDGWTDRWSTIKRGIQNKNTAARKDTQDVRELQSQGGQLMQLRGSNRDGGAYRKTLGAGGGL